MEGIGNIKLIDTIISASVYAKKNDLSNEKRKIVF